MSSLPPTPIMNLHQFDTDDAMLNTEVNENFAQTDLLPPTVCTSSTRPTTDLFQGRLIYETDTENVLMYDLTGPSWRILGTSELMPAPQRGYFINSTKNVTATSWADVSNDSAKSIDTPKKLMVSVTIHASLTGTGSTALSARLAWSGATTGNSYSQQDSAVLGAITSTETDKRMPMSATVMLNPGITTFKLQAQRSNTTNATSVQSAAITVTPIAWGDQYVSGAE